MNSNYVPRVGALLHFNFPGCGFGIVVARERMVNDVGQSVILTHILWQSNAWSEIEDFSISPHDPFWKIILPQLPLSTVIPAQKLWQQLVENYRKKESL